MLSSVFRGLNRTLFMNSSSRLLATERKLVAGADYFRNIAENVDHTTKRLDDLNLIDEEIVKPREKLLNEQDAVDFAKKVRHNPNRFIENRRPKSKESFF